MRKVFIFLILICGDLYALERESTLKMYHGIFEALISKRPVFVYVKDKEYREVFRHSSQIRLSDTLAESDIVLITQERMLKSVLGRINVDKTHTKKPILFVTNYHFLGQSQDIVGAFYWRKGRSQLLFVKDRLKQQHIALPKEYQNFIIDQL